MDPKIQEAFLEYEQLKLQCKEIEERMEELKPTLVDALPDNEEIVAHHGKFVKAKRTTWTYTPETQKIEEDLKEKKKIEVQKGLAKGVDTFYVMYKESK